jgi:hypothetical protein
MAAVDPALSSGTQFAPEIMGIIVEAGIAALVALTSSITAGNGLPWNGTGTAAMRALTFSRRTGLKALRALSSALRVGVYDGTK